MRTTNAKDKVVDALEELLATHPLEKLSVADVAAVADISRQTFYYHFENIFGVYRYALEKGMISSSDEIPSPAAAVSSISEVMKRYRNMTAAFTNKHYRRDTIEILVDYLMHVVKKFLADKYGWSGPPQNPDRVARFFATGYVCIIMRWVDVGMKDDVAAKIDEINQELSMFHSFAAQNP